MAIITSQSAPSALISVYSWAHKAQKSVVPIIKKAQDTSILAFTSFLAILDQYPPLKAFVFSFAAFAAIPVSVFVGFSVISGSILLATFSTGFFIVQGSLVSIAAFFLFWWVLGALFFAGITAFWFTTGYLGLVAAKKLAA